MVLEPESDFELPAIVVGRRFEERELSRLDFAGARWCAAFTHPCGGYACLQQSIAGIVLPLAWNAGDDTALDVVRGLDTLASDSPSAARRRCLPAKLEALHLTAGKTYDREQLEALHRARLHAGEDVASPNALGWRDAARSRAARRRQRAAGRAARSVSPLGKLRLARVDHRRALGRRFLVGPVDRFFEAAERGAEIVE